MDYLDSEINETNKTPARHEVNIEVLNDEDECFSLVAVVWEYSLNRVECLCVAKLALSQITGFPRDSVFTSVTASNLVYIMHYDKV